jgi:hypothetical protein
MSLRTRRRRGYVMRSPSLRASMQRYATQMGIRVRYLPGIGNVLCAPPIRFGMPPWWQFSEREESASDFIARLSGKRDPGAAGS